MKQAGDTEIRQGEEPGLILSWDLLGVTHGGDTILSLADPAQVTASFLLSAEGR